MVEIIQGQKQKEASLLPTRLEVLREYNNRKALSEKYKEELSRLESGTEGEQIVLDYIHTYGLPHWKVVKNGWFENYGVFECDLLLITKSTWYPIEIKHYSGQYDLKNNQWRCYGTKLPNNPINQAQKLFVHFEQIIREAKLPVNVSGKLIFSGDHFHLTVTDQIGDLEIVTINHLRDHIRNIAWKERNSHAKQINADLILSFINQYETTNPFGPENLYPELGDKIEKGVKCSHCASFAISISRSYISCHCGMREPTERAIIRTICEFGVIHFYKDFISSELIDFFNGDFAATTIRKYLSKFFKRTGKSNATRYGNQNITIETIDKYFDFTHPRYFLYP